MPTDRRTKPTSKPSAFRRSGGIDACVMIAGCSASDSTPPSDSAQVNTRNADRNFRARASAPLPLRNAKLTMPPKPDIWRRASACCGCDRSPGYSTHATSRRDSSQRETASALASCRCMRTASVLVPRSTRKLSNAGWLPPIEFCRNASRARRSGSRPMTAPPTTSEWPFRYFVVEWTTRSAPRSSGR